MFKALKIVSYSTSDLQGAKQWYTKVLGQNPVYDSPIIVVFKIDDIMFSFVPGIKNAANNPGDTLVYWEVDDFEESLKTLQHNGAKPVSDINTFMKIRTIKVADPFGNILGIAGKVTDAKTGSLEQQPSESAMTVAFCRAFAAYDSREEIRGRDYLAEIFLTEDRRQMIKQPGAREWIANKMFLYGIYEYFIARTVYLDEIMLNALEENIPQIAFLGAGYDTRAYRFINKVKDTRIFELDSKPTQDKKREILQANNVPVPDRLIYVPINFEKESIAGTLVKSGFNKNEKAIFIWEGVTYYLTPEIVDNTIEQVKSISTTGSKLYFDYMADSENIRTKYGVKESLELMKSTYAAEKFQYFIQEGEIGKFLKERGFRLINHLASEDIEEKYLKLKNGSLASKIAGYFCFAEAEVE